MTLRHEYLIKGKPLLPEPFHYTLSGLPDIYLLNGVTFHEDDGYGPSYEIEHMEALHDAIASGIIARTDEIMSGAELRFLRKRMKKTQEDLARQLRISEQTVANYEKGATAINGPIDYAMRVIYVLHFMPEDKTKDFLSEISEAFRDEVELDDRHVPRPKGWNEARPHLAA